MKIRIVRDIKDHNKLSAHLNVNLFKFCDSCEESAWQDFDDFDDDDDEDEEIFPLFRRYLFMIPGIQDVTFDKYNINFVKGEVFSWDEILVAIRARLELEFNKGEPAEYCDVRGEKRTFVQRIKDLVIPRIKVSV